MGIVFKFSSKPEKVIAAATAAFVLSIVFDDHKRKEKGSKKYQNFPKRMKKNYDRVDSILKKTLAKELYDGKVHYKDEKLEALTIENGETIKL